jgi:hypothetical protein
MCAFTVSSLILRRSATRLFEFPLATCSSASTYRAVSESAAAYSAICEAASAGTRLWPLWTARIAPSRWVRSVALSKNACAPAIKAQPA